MEEGTIQVYSEEQVDAIVASQIGGFPKGVRQNDVKDVLRNRKNLTDLTAEERRLAADWYEKEVAPNTAGGLKDIARDFNLARAKYLREGGEHPGATIYEFMKKTGRTP
jgi:hypothetical protein